MQRIRKIFKVFLCLCLLAVTALMFNVTHKQNYKGSYSSATVCTQNAREFIVKEFGDSQNIEELLKNVNRFACKRFTYVSKGVYLQYFDIDDFIFKDNFHGLCWDFACFTKVVVLEISALKGWRNVDVFVCDVFYPESGDKHSFNFVSVEDNIYYLDNTSDNNRYKSGRKPFGVGRLLCDSKEEYFEKNNMILMNYH